MKRLFNKVFFLCLPVLWCSCTSILPVNNQYEKAGTLKQGHAELAGHYTAYNVSHFGRTEASNSNYGFRIGYGMMDGFDLKFRYERLVFTRHFDGQLREADFFSVIPKFALIPEQFSLLVPIGAYHARYRGENASWKRSITSIAPQLIYTFTGARSKSDLSLSIRSDYLYSNAASESNLFLGGSIGAGFSSDLSKWAIRPEIGLSSEGSDGTYWSYGVGFQYFLFRKGR